MTDFPQEAAPLSAPWLAQLLALPTAAAQVAQLRADQFLTVNGLTELLDYAENLAQRNPGQMRQIAALCEEAAQQADAPTLVPRALYLRAQSHAINGELKLALEVVEAARLGFWKLGLTLDALRTNIGQMRVLGELGRFQEALVVGQQVVDWVDATMRESQSPAPPEAETLLALAKTQQGICYIQLGRFQAALATLQSAETLYESRGMVAHSAAVKNNRGLALVYMGAVSDALLVFTTAAHLQAAEGLTLLQGHTQSNLGEAHLLLGNYRSALAAFEQARLLLATQDALTDQQINLRQMADAYLALNLFAEAVATYREVEQHLAHAGMVHERAWALWGMGSALAGQAQLSAAAETLAAAAAAFAAIANAPLLAGVRLEQAALLERQGDKGSALELAQQSLALVAEGEWPIQQFFAHLRLADLHFPDPAVVELHLKAAQMLSERLALPHLRYRLDQRLGRLRLLQQRPTEAATILEQAVADIESLRNTLPLEAMRISFLRDKVAVYEMLIQIYLDRGDAESIGRAFHMAEQARARTLLERMTGLVETGIATAAAPDVQSRLQTLQADLNAIYSQLLRQESTQADESVTERAVAGATLHARAMQVEQEIRLLQLQAAPDTALPAGFTMPLPLATIQQHLAADRVLIVYYLLDDEILAFVTLRTQLQVVRQLSTRGAVAPLLHRLQAQWERFRAGNTFVRRHLGLLHQSTQRVLQELYATLFAPVEAVLGILLSATCTQAGDKNTEPCHLTIVPHSLLHGVPFQALFDGQQSLVERYHLTYAPSASALSLLQQRTLPQQTQERPTRVVILGVAEPELPAIDREVAAVAAQFVAATVHSNETATVQTLRDLAPTADILHLACHGIFRADNPLFSALKLADGWLTAVEVGQFRLSCALVVLSACESGRGQSLEGDEMLGLARAFLGAGSATLVVSQWMVQDEATATLMTHFYANLAAGQPVATALRAAQLTLKARVVHPYYWAPFVLLGNDALQVQ